ncbi:MAG TPA: tetratricopeptide repeat protein, partial [Pyrinomonadaceae bacterium]
EWWNGLGPNTKNLIVTIVGGVAVVIICGLWVWFRNSLIASRCKRAKAPPRDEVTDKETHGASAPSSLIPRPPLVGFVPRHDADGRKLVELLKTELAAGRHQLVTLSGLGGVGKTIVAAEAARVLHNAYSRRLVWSDVAARAGYTLSTLLDDIATQLDRADLRTRAPEAKETEVRALVADSPCLIVVDNYETIAVAQQPPIQAWFQRARCAVLFTSRQKIDKTLNIVLSAMRHKEVEELLTRLIKQTQDRQLFSAKVRQRIYETAEANPFLIEWLVAQIAQAREPRTVLAELAQGEGDAAARVFDRSFNLPEVGDDGRAALLALSLFVPSASRRALAEVAGFGDDERRLSAAVKNLRALWLIKGLNENSRFTVEGVTRGLAGARLAKDPRAAEFRQRYVTYFTDYAEAHTEPTREAYDARQAELDNLLRAVDVAAATEDWPCLHRLVNALAVPPDGMLILCGYWNQTLRLEELELTAARASRWEEVIAVWAHDAATMYQRRGELTEVRRLYEESLEIRQKLGDQRGIANSLHQLGLLAEAEGDKAEAARLLREALDIFERLKAPYAEIARRNLARVEG